MKMSILKAIKELIDPSYETRMKRATASRERDLLKIRKNGEKLIQRDLEKGKSWTFYLAKQDGTYTEAKTHDDYRAICYEKTSLCPEIANAIVVTPSGYLIRKGLEDLELSGLRFNKNEMQVFYPYRIPLDDPEAEKRATARPNLAELFEDDEPDDYNFDEDEEDELDEDEEYEDEDYEVKNHKDNGNRGRKKGFDIENGILVKAKLNLFEDTSIKIPHGVTKIGPKAFLDFCCLQEVTIPDGVTAIGDRAFEKCEDLERVVIPSSVVHIGEKAFYNCEKLKKVTIPKGVTKIESCTFWGCAFENITIPDGVTSIEDFAFAFCEKLKSIRIPSSVTNIGQNAFTNCDSLKRIVIPTSVKRVGYQAFKGSGVEDIYYMGSEEDANKIGLKYSDVDDHTVVHHNYRGT